MKYLLLAHLGLAILISSPKAFAGAELIERIALLLRSPVGVTLLAETQEGRILAARLGLSSPDWTTQDLTRHLTPARESESLQQDLYLRLQQFENGGYRTSDTLEPDLVRITSGARQFLTLRSRVFNPVTEINRIEFVNPDEQVFTQFRRSFLAGTTPSPQSYLPSQSALQRITDQYHESWMVRFLLAETPEGQALLRRLQTSAATPFRDGSLSWDLALERLRNPELSGLVLDLDYRLGRIMDAMTNVWVDNARMKDFLRDFASALTLQPPSPSNPQILFRSNFRLLAEPRRGISWYRSER